MKGSALPRKKKSRGGGVTQSIDKSIEDWTWERYLRIQDQLVPQIEQTIREQLMDELLPKIDKQIEGWTWERYGRLLDERDMVITKMIPRGRLWSVAVHLVEHCNLNCRCCDNYSPIAEEAYTDLEELDKDFARLRELTGGEIGIIYLSGGEAMLHPQLTDFFKLTRGYFERTDIQLQSNGILLQTAPDSFWEACREYNITIILTKYPIDLNEERISEKAKEFGVTWRYFNTEPVKTTYFIPVDPTGSQNGRANFIRCFHANSCIYMKHGRIYTCSIAVNIEHFNRAFEENLPDIPENSISIYEAENIQEILAFLSRPIPLCDYCDVKGRKFGLPWGISKKEKSEWASV